MIVMAGKRLGGVDASKVISGLGFMIIMYQRIYAEENFMCNMIEYIEKARKSAGKQDMIMKVSDLYDNI